MIKSPLATETYAAYEGNFTYGRSGRKIEAVTIHHMAGKLTAKRCGDIFQQVGRNGSSHYGIGYNGEIACYVGEENTAWTNSNWDSNCKSVTIETSNNVNGGNWTVSDASLNSLIRLVADIAKRNNLGKLVKGKNLTWHCLFANTSCPGQYLLSKLDYIVEEANKLNESINLKYEKIEKKSVILNKNTNLWNLNFSNWNQAQSVKQFSKGTQIDNIVAVATHPLGSKYYITEYSYNNKIDNGFNVADCDNLQNNPVEPPKEEVSPIIPDKPKTDDNKENTPIVEPIKNKEKFNIIQLIVDFIKKVLNYKKNDK